MRTLQFGGYEWQLKSGQHGPGPNDFSDDERSVWLDDRGLHLTIRKSGNKWLCSEVIQTAKMEYRAYGFQVIGWIDRLDPNVVFAMFAYGNDHHEYDIEFSRWRDPHGYFNGSYAIQPDHNYPFHFELTGTYSTHYFEPDLNYGTVFGSYHGHGQVVEGARIAQWNSGWQSWAPFMAEMHIRINLWLAGGHPPTDGKDVEVVVSAIGRGDLT